MTTEEYRQSLSHITAPNFDGGVDKLKDILVGHWMWLNGIDGGCKADLSRANLSWADLSWVNLSWADLSRANLSWVDLSWVNLSWADLSEAKYLSHDGQEKKIKFATGWSNLYKYWVFAVQFEDDTQSIQMGCHYRSVDDWESDFWNNSSEFPNDNSENSLMRLNAYNFAKQWLKIKAGTP